MKQLFSIINFPLWMLLVFGLVIIYLVIRRIEEKKKENFEDRDN